MPDVALPQRILLTGAAGFVGRHVAELLSGKTELRCFTRRTSRTDCLPADARVFRGNLEDGSGLEAALEGMDEGDAVIHLAAALFAVSWQDYLCGNVTLAARLGEAARRAVVGRIVMVSSLAATGPSARSPGVEDDTPPAPVSAYGWSKYAAELALTRALFASGNTYPRLVVLRPPIIYGPGDKGLLPYFRAARIGLVVIPRKNPPVSLVHVYDAAQAVLCCLKTEARGLYHLNDGAEHSMASFGTAVASAFGRKARVLPLPLPLLAFSAALSSFAARLGLPPASWNADKYREARAEGWLCSARRITEELGYTPAVPLREGIAHSIAGYRRMGRL